MTEPTTSNALRVVAAAVSFALVLGLGSAAPADEPNERETAQAMLRRATELYDRGEFAAALAELEAAYQLTRDPRVLPNLAVVLSEMGREREAADHLARYVAHPAAEPPARRKAAQVLEQLRQSLGTLVLTAPGHGDRVLLDGKPVGVTPLEAQSFHLDPGSHELRVESSPPIVETIRFAAGETITKRLETPAGDPGSIAEAKRPTDVTPETTRATADRPIPSPRDASPPAWKRVWFWSAAATVACLGAGVGFSLETRATERALDDIVASSMEHDFTEAQRLRDRGEREALLASGFYVAAGAAAVVTVAAWMFRRKPSPTDRVTLQPILRPDAAGIQSVIRF